MGGAADHCSNVVRLIVAGNSITDNPVKSSTATVDNKVCSYHMSIILASLLRCLTKVHDIPVFMI